MNVGSIGRVRASLAAAIVALSVVTFMGAGRASAAPVHTLVAAGGLVPPTCGATGTGGGSNSGFLPDDGTGNPVSDSKLDMGWSTGGGLFGGENVPRNAVGQLTDLTFQVQRIIAHFSIAQVNAALQFCYVSDGPLPATATHISESFQSQVVGPLGLLLFFVALMLFSCGWHALRGRVSRGVAELAVSLLILTLTLATWAQPSTLLLGQNGLMAQGRDASTTVGGVIATGHPPPDPTNPHSDIYQPLLEGMEKAFIFTPHSLLDWGQNFNGAGQPQACVDAYNHIVATGPHGTDDGPRDQMVAAGCSTAKDFNYTPSASRLADAVVALIGSLFLFALMVVLAFGMILCQFAMLAAVVSAPFVFAAGVLPWGGRRWLAKWVSGVLAAFLGQVVAVTVLSLVMVAVGAVAGQAGTDGQPLFNVLALMDIIIVAGILYWLKWRHASKRAARRLAAQVAGTQFGVGGEGGRGGAAQGAIRGLAPRGSAAGVAAAAVTGAGAASLAERSTRYVRQRTRRSSTVGGGTNGGGQPRQGRQGQNGPRSGAPNNRPNSGGGPRGGPRGGSGGGGPGGSGPGGGGSGGSGRNTGPRNRGPANTALCRCGHLRVRHSSGTGRCSGDGGRCWCTGFQQGQGQSSATSNNRNGGARRGGPRGGGGGRGSGGSSNRRTAAGGAAAGAAVVAPHREPGVDLDEKEKQRLDKEWAALSEDPDDDEVEAQYAEFLANPPPRFRQRRVGGVMVMPGDRVVDMDDVG